MTEAIVVALIGATSTVIAALIGVAGIYILFLHRKTVIQLTKQIEAYHAQEGNLVRALLQQQSQATEVSDEQIMKWRGTYRSQYPQGNTRPQMTPEQAKKIRRQYFNFE